MIELHVTVKTKFFVRNIVNIFLPINFNIYFVLEMRNISFDFALLNRDLQCMVGNSVATACGNTEEYIPVFSVLLCLFRKTLVG